MIEVDKTYITSLTPLNKLFRYRLDWDRECTSTQLPSLNLGHPEIMMLTGQRLSIGEVVWLELLDEKGKVQAIWKFGGCRMVSDKSEYSPSTISFSSEWFTERILK